ncbi:MAG TPA: prepilin peptidase [bacterium]|mgnify:CR=1 FL=1|nr:prepilin peptidase [bacterium]
MLGLSAVTIITIFLFFIAGAAIGSFLNVVIERTHQRQSFWQGRSFCNHCNHQLAWYDLIPLLSFLSLGAKCRYCRKALTWQYFFLELLTGLGFVALWWRFAAEGYGILAFWLFLFSFLVVIFVYDLKYQYIYDRFSLPAIALAFIAQIVWQPLTWWQFALGGLVGAGIYLGLYYLSGGKDIGGGDIRLGALLGFLVGLKSLLYVLLYSYLIAVLVLLIYYLAKRKKIKYLPLGPFLISGLMLYVFFPEVTVKLIDSGFGKIVDFLI